MPAIAEGTITVLPRLDSDAGRVTPMVRERSTHRPLFGPLEKVLRLWQQRGGDLGTEDFVHLEVNVTAAGTTLYTYKHRRSRRCIHLDEAGHAYSFHPQAGDGAAAGTFRPLDAPGPALSRLPT